MAIRMNYDDDTWDKWAWIISLGAMCLIGLLIFIMFEVK